MSSPSFRWSREPRGLSFPFPTQRRFCQVACSSSCSRINERYDWRISGSCSLRRSFWRSLSSGIQDGPVIGPSKTCFADVEGGGFGGVNPGGLDHLPGTGTPCGCLKGTEGFSPKPRFGEGEVCEFCLRRTGLHWLSASTGGLCGLGLAHFETGGAHFPRPAGVDVVNGEGGAFGLLLETSHPLGRALTWMKQRVM